MELWQANGKMGVLLEAGVSKNFAGILSFEFRGGIKRRCQLKKEEKKHDVKPPFNSHLWHSLA